MFSSSGSSLLRTLIVVAAGLCLAVGGIAIVVVVALPSGSDLCANDKVVEVLSPNGQRKAVSFRRNCGATTSYSTQVSILPAKTTLPNESGNIFVVDDEPMMTLRWINDQHLHISGAGETDFLRRMEFRGVQITYE